MVADVRALRLARDVALTAAFVVVAPVLWGIAGVAFGAASAVAAVVSVRRSWRDGTAE